MARTDITPTRLGGTATIEPAGTAVDPTNGHSVAFDQLTPPTHLVIDIDSTFAGAKTFTLKAAVQPNGPLTFPPAAALGDMAISLNAQRAQIVIARSRFVQPDGNLYIDVQAAATGTIRAYYSPA